MSRPRTVQSIVALIVTLGASLPAQTTLLLNPKATYLRTSSDPSAPGATAYPLAPMGLMAGGWCTLQQLGDFSYTAGGADNGRSLLAVFSTSSTLLASSNQARVPGAVATGPIAVTGPSYFGSLATDIPADFFVSANDPSPHSVYVHVPLGAQFVFFSVADSFYGDNSDPDSDFGVTVTPVASPIRPGTGEDLVVSSGVNGTATAGPGLDQKVAAVNNQLTISVESPFGTLASTQLVYGALLTVGPPTATNFYGIPELWIDPLSSAFVAFAPLLSALPTGTTSVVVAVPSGLAGIAAVVQAVVAAPLTRNGAYAAANAHILLFQ